MSVGPGQFRLHRQADPALDAGTYRVRITADTDAGVARQDDRFFEVTGPRLRLTPPEVAATAPPAEAAGNFADQLPYVVLTRRTLPWERSGPVGADGMWLALLITRESPDAEATFGTGTLGEAVTLPGVPPGEPVSLLRVNSVGLPAVRAQLRGLALRCHLREINLADTATMGPDDDGWQAIVLGARLCAAADEPGVAYRATLVSVEGRTDLPLVAGVTSATFVALHSWTFTSFTGGATFERLVAERLDVDRFGGTAVLPAVDRAGRESVVRYRSPLKPSAAPAEPPDDGVEDVTARSAFELGRMLAAADGRLLRDLVAWRRLRQRAVTGAVTDVALIDAFGAHGIDGLEGAAVDVSTRPASSRSARAAREIRRLRDTALPTTDPFDVRRPS